MKAVDPAVINRFNEDYWRDQHRLMLHRFGDSAIRETALALIRSEQQRCVPVYSQMTLEGALARADLIHDHAVCGSDAYKRFTVERARKAGMAKKTDALQALIEDLVEQNPKITEPALRRQLSHESYPDLIEDADEDEIWFTNNNGRSKTAKGSGLKDRLSRAKTKLARANRIPRSR
jgi:hypothetical protein